MTDTIKAVTAVVLAVLAIRAVGAAHLTPVSDPSGVTVRAFAVNRVAVVTVFTGGTHFLAVFSKETFKAKLIASRPVPASITGDAASLCHLTRLLALTMSTPVPAVLTVEPGRTRFPAELPTVPWRAGTRAVRLVALAVDALTVAFAARAPQTLPTLAASRELVARGVITVTLDGAVPSSPAGVALAPSCHGVAYGVDAAVAVVVALRTPGARVACAFARVLVTLAFLAKTRVLTVRTPTVMVAGTCSGEVIALAVGVTVALPLAVRTPKLSRTLSVTAGSKISMSAAAFIGPDTHLLFLTGEVSFAERCQAFVP